MATICDACGEKFGRDAGHSTLHVSPPRPDMKLFQALVTAGRSFTSHDPLALDLCLACTAKTLARLGLPTDVCELPAMPTTPTPDEDPDRPPAGALTEEDLRQLGLVDQGNTVPKS